MNDIRDISLAPSGELKIAWVRRNMAVLRGIEADFAAEKPFAGMKIALSVHLEAKTAYLCRVLAAGGAEMYVTGSNPLSTQDDVAAALIEYAQGTGDWSKVKSAYVDGWATEWNNNEESLGSVPQAQKFDQQG